MPVYLRCEHCQKRLKIPEDVVGRAIKCPACGGVFKSDPSQVLPAPAKPSPSPVVQVLAPVAAAPSHQSEAATGEPDVVDVLPARRKTVPLEDDDEDDRPARRKRRHDEEDEEDDEGPEKAKAGRRRTPWYVMLPLILLSLSAVGLAWLWTIGFTALGLERNVFMEFDTRVMVGVGSAAAVILLCLLVALLPVRSWLRFLLVFVFLGLGYGGSFGAVYFWKDLPFGK